MRPRAVKKNVSGIFAKITKQKKIENRNQSKCRPNWSNWKFSSLPFNSHRLKPQNLWKNFSLDLKPQKTIIIRQTLRSSCKKEGLGFVRSRIKALEKSIRNCVCAALFSNHQMVQRFWRLHWNLIFVAFYFHLYQNFSSLWIFSM